MTIVPPTANARATHAAAAINCASGKHCAFLSAGYKGDVMAFSSCTSNQSLAALGSAKSVVNNRTGKTVKAYKGSTLLASIGANSGKDVAGATKLSCG